MGRGRSTGGSGRHHYSSWEHAQMPTPGDCNPETRDALTLPPPPHPHGEGERETDIWTSSRLLSTQLLGARGYTKLAASKFLSPSKERDLPKQTAQGVLFCFVLREETHETHLSLLFSQCLMICTQQIIKGLPQSIWYLPVEKHSGDNVASQLCMLGVGWRQCLCQGSLHGAAERT